MMTPFILSRGPEPLLDEKTGPAIHKMVKRQINPVLHSWYLEEYP
jgi:hypothetical protein